MPNPGDVLNSILGTAPEAPRPALNPSAVLQRVLGAPATAPQVLAGLPHPSDVLKKVLGGPQLDMSGEWVQTPTGRVRRDIWEQEQGYAQEAAARVPQGIEMTGPAGPSSIELTPQARAGFVDEDVRDARDGVAGRLLDVAQLPVKRIVNLGRKMGYEEGQGNSALGAGLQSVTEGAGRDLQSVKPLAGPMTIPNAAFQAGIEPAIRYVHNMPQSEGGFEDRFQRGLTGETVAADALLEGMPQVAPGSLPDWAGGSRREESINNAVQTLYGLGATGVDLIDLDTFAGGAAADAAFRAGRRNAIEAGMKDLVPTVPHAEAAQMARAAEHQAVGQTMEQARQLGLDPSAKQVTSPEYQSRVRQLAVPENLFPERPLQRLADTERQLAPAATGPKLRQGTPSEPGKVLQQVLSKEAPPAPPAPESTLPEPAAARAVEQAPTAREEAPPPDDFFEGTEGYDRELGTLNQPRGDSRPRTIAELRAESEARLAAQEARNPTKTYPVPDREISLDEVVQARDVVNEWSKRPEVRGKIRQTSQGIDHPDLVALMPPEVREAKLTTELWQGQRRATPDAHQAAVRAAEVEVGKVAPPEVNPRGRLKPGELAQDAQGSYVDMGTRRYRLSEADAEHYRMLPEAGIDPASWLKTRRYEPAPPRPDLVAAKAAPDLAEGPRSPVIDNQPVQRNSPRAGLDFEADPVHRVDAPASSQVSELRRRMQPEAGAGRKEVELEAYSSRNRENLDVDEAHRRTKSPAQEEAKRTYEQIDREEGVHFSHQDAVGTFLGIPENSIISNLEKQATDEQVLRAAARRGQAFDQDAVAIFHDGPERPGFRVPEGAPEYAHYAPATKVTIDVSKSMPLRRVKEIIDGAGITSHTIVERPTHWEVRAVLKKGDTDALDGLERAQRQNGLPVLSWSETEGHSRLLVRGEYQDGTPARSRSVLPPTEPDLRGRAQEAVPGRTGNLPPPDAIGKPREPAGAGPRVGQDAELHYEVNGHKVQLSGAAKPLPLPALIRFVKEITGDVPSISEGLVELGKKMGGTVRGKVQGARNILLNPAILKDPILAARVAAHEIGHLDSWVQGARTGIADSVSQVRKRMRNWFRGMDEETRKELWQASKEWRPIDEAAAKPSELRYRQDPEELFADAISRMFHDPEELERIAPKFWGGFTKMLDAAPQLKQSIADLHAWRSGTLEDQVKHIRQEIATDLVKGEDLFKALRTEAKAREDSLLYRMGQNWWNQLRSEWSDTGAAMKGWANKLERMGLEVPEHIDPRLTYDVWQMPDGATHKVLEGFNSDVLQPIRAAGLDERQVGEWIEWQAIADGHRAGMANPKGKTPVEAREALRQIESTLSPEQLSAVKTAGEKTRAMFWDALQEGRDMIGSDALERLKAHKETLAPMLELQKLHEGAKLEDILSSIEAGSFRDAQNPLITMVQQTIAIRNWARRNKARGSMLDFVRAFEPDEIATKAGAGKEAFVTWKDGVKQTDYVDPYLESLFQVSGTREVNTLVKLLSGQVGPAPLRAAMKFGNASMMNLWLRWNPAFYAAQGAMDMFRSSRNLASVGLYKGWAPGNSLRVLKSWGEALKPALDYARNKPNDLISKMYDEHAILPPDLSLTNQLAGDQLGSMAQLDTILHQAGVNTAQAMQQGGRLKKVAGWMGDFWTVMGRMSEVVPKVGAYNELSKSAKFSPEMRAHIVRTKIGQPAGYSKGTQMKSSGRVLAFANTILQGLRSDVHLMATPKTRSGFLVAAMKHATTPKLLMAAAGAGLMGKELAEMYAAIPERDKRNGTPIPIFWDHPWEEGGEFGRKVRYFMVPSDPTDKLFGSFIHELLTAPTSDREAQDYVKDLQETLADFQPGFTPAIEGGLALSDALTKDEPKDSGGRPIVSKDEAQAGLLPRLNGYVRWQLGQGGVIGQTIQASVYRENLRQASDWTPANIPTLGRFFKVSDAGFAERQRREETLEQRGQARNRISYGPTVRELRQQYSRLQKLGIDKRTPQQQDAYDGLKEWHSLYESQAQEVEMASDPKAAQAARDSLERLSQSYMSTFQRQTKRKW